MNPMLKNALTNLCLTQTLIFVSNTESYIYIYTVFYQDKIVYLLYKGNSKRVVLDKMNKSKEPPNRMYSLCTAVA